METAMTVCLKSQIRNINIVVGCPVGCPYCYAACNCRRFHMTDDFSKPVFFERKLSIMDKPQPTNWFLTGMSDYAFWEPEWTHRILSRMEANPQHNYIMLSKRPNMASFSTDLDSAWLGVTVNSRKDLHRIDELRRDVRAKHYHVTFEPLFDDPGVIDLDGIEWVVVGTETGRRKGKFVTDPSWAFSITDQCRDAGVPVFMKEDLLPIIGERDMVQEFPPEFMLPGVSLDG